MHTTTQYEHFTLHTTTIHANIHTCSVSNVVQSQVGGGRSGGSQAAAVGKGCVAGGGACESSGSVGSDSGGGSSV